MSASGGGVDERRLAELRAACGAGPVLILTHDNPDPDALASGKVLATLLGQAWGIASRMVYSGIVARAENRAVLGRLTPEWEHADVLPDLERYSAVALVDTQPGAGNNRLPSAPLPDVVFDHHQPIRERIAAVRFADVRPEIGATVTLLNLYLGAAGIEPDPVLATAMFYALKTDTRGLSRGTSPDDEAFYLQLLARVDRRRLVEVEQAGLSRGYYQAFSLGLQATRLFGRAVVTRLGVMDRPDLAAEMADLLVRLDEAQAVLCMGQHAGTLHLSLRTKPSTDTAGQVIQQIIAPPGIGGGHRSMAGAQVPLAGRPVEGVMDEIEARFLQAMGEAGSGVALVEA